MKCSQLLEHLEYTCLQGSTDVKVTAVVNDSRKIEEGCLFLCIKEQLLMDISLQQRLLKRSRCFSRRG